MTNATTTGDEKPEITAEAVAEHLTYKDAEAIAEAYIALGITASEDPEEIAEEIEECYSGSFRSDADFAENMAEELGDIPRDFPAWIRIDWDASARDLMMDYSEQDGHYFRNV